MTPQPTIDNVSIFTTSDLHSQACIPTTPDVKQKIYAAWAPTYEHDHHANAYAAPYTVAEYAFQFILKHISHSQHLTILDAGCGTGMVIEGLHPSLKNEGLNATIIGVDFSTDMLKHAQAKNIYDQLLQANLDLPLPIPKDSIDVATCCGVFVAGHCGPSALPNILRCLRIGGIFVFSLRDTTFDEEGVEYLRVIKESGGEVIGDFVRPYLGPVNAHFMVIRRQIWDWVTAATQWSRLDGYYYHIYLSPVAWCFPSNLCSAPNSSIAHFLFLPFAHSMSFIIFFWVNLWWT